MSHGSLASAVRASLAIVLVAVGAPHVANGRETATREDAAPTRAELEAHVAALAADEMAGRDTTESGGRAAAAYVADAFEKAGLERVGDAWTQSYVVPQPVLGEGNVLEVRGPAATSVFAVERDWNPLSPSATGAAEGRAVFAGYGIVHPDRGHDDYEDVDVQGAVVLVLRKDPGWGDARHMALLTKLSVAADRGAAALLIVNDPGTVAEAGGDVLAHWSANIGAPVGSAKIPFAFVSQDVAAAILGEGDMGSIAEKCKRGPCARALEGTNVRVVTAVSRTRETNAANVVGKVSGRDPDLAREVVVLGAHYDHVGLGRYGSLGGTSAAGQVHNGADDNASGTAVLLEVAEWFALPENRPRRTVVFVAFSGEEIGLLGSREFCDTCPIPLGTVVTMVNLDMVGRLRERKLDVGGVGTGRDLRAIVEEANRERAFSITWDEQGEAPTDSTSFFRKGVPVLWFFTGLHDDYHRPSDDAALLNYEGLEDVALLTRDVARALAERDERIVFQRPPAPPRPPVLGIRPARAADVAEGVVVEAVVADGPAAEAGVRPGDVIVGLAGQVVRTMEDLLRVLRRLEPGKPVEVVVLRDGERLEVSVVLGERASRR
jgi:hypothetical protein